MTPPRIATRARGGRIAILIAIAIGQAAAAAAAALATRWLFTAMDQDVPLPVAGLAMLGGSAVAIALLRVLFRRLGEGLGQDYACDVRLALFDHASRMSPRDLAARRVGYLTLRFVGDLTALKDWPARGVPLLVEGAVMAPAMVVILFVLDPGFGLIGLALAGLSVSVLALGTAGLMREHRMLRARRAALAADMAERLPIAPELAAMGRRRLELRLIRRRAAQLTQAAQARITRGEGMRALPDAVSGLAAAGLIWWGARSGLPTGDIAAGLAVLALAARPLRDLMGVTDRAAAFRAAHAKLAAALARPLSANAPAPEAATRLPAGPLALLLRDVDTGRGSPTSLSLAPGGRADLPPGIDADRLFLAIRGLDPAPAGEISLNGHAVRALSPGTLRRSIVHVGAHPVVLKGSLRRALTLGLSTRPDDAGLLRQVEAAGLAGVLQGLGGLNRRVGEGARTMPAEARVALSVLRAALGRPGVLLVADPDLLCMASRTWLAAHPATVLCAGTDVRQGDVLPGRTGSC